LALKGPKPGEVLLQKSHERHLDARLDSHIPLRLRRQAADLLQPNVKVLEELHQARLQLSRLLAIGDRVSAEDAGLVAGQVPGESTHNVHHYPMVVHQRVIGCCRDGFDQGIMLFLLLYFIEALGANPFGHGLVGEDDRFELDLMEAVPTHRSAAHQTLETLLHQRPEARVADGAGPRVLFSAMVR